MPVITTDIAREQRSREVENAFASVRMEGLEPSSKAKTLFDRYVEGDMTSDELGRAIDQLLDEEYGPVRLPRNECS
jgi:Antitoxin VbhA